MSDSYDNTPPTSRVNSGQVWAGGLATAVIAALVAVVGVLISRWLLHVPILAPSHEGAWGSANTAYYALAAACIALAATALLNLLMIAAPEPTTFLSWILGLATLAGVVFPFSTSAPVSQKFATAIVNLVIGIAIWSLLLGVASRAYRGGGGGGGQAGGPAGGEHIAMDPRSVPYNLDGPPTRREPRQ
jgi:hypothetical protein